MRLKNDRHRYGAVAQALHWLIALLVFAMFALGLTMGDLPLGPDKVKVYNLHKSIGLTILTLVLLRLLWRRASPPPPLPVDMPRWENAAARLSHALLYALLLAQPVVGWVHAGAANFPVVVYGFFTLPQLTGPDETLKKTLEGAHWFIALAILVVVCVHVAAALRHHFLLKDEVLRRMLPWGRT